MISFIKDPDDQLDYTVNWTSWLDAGDTITTSQWITPAGLTVGDGANGMPAASNTTTHTTLWLGGGTAGQLYEVVNRITTAGGRRKDRTLRIEVRQQ